MRPALLFGSLEYPILKLQVLQCDKTKKKATPSSGPPPSMPPRQRASTLGVITEILDGSPKQGLPPSTSSGGSRNNRLNRSRNLSASSSNSSFHGSDSKNLSALPVVAGKLWGFFQRNSSRNS